MDNENETKVSFNITEPNQDEAVLQLNEVLFESLWKLSLLENSALEEIADYVLKESIQLTGSKHGFLATLDKEESVMTVHAWSKDTNKDGSTSSPKTVYSVKTAGFWAEAVRQRKIVVINDFLKLGLPKQGLMGQVKITRYLSVPILDSNKIVVLIGVANKKTDYTYFDSLMLNMLVMGMWILLKRQESQDQLRKSEVQKQALINALPDLIIRIDKDGILLDIYPPDEISREYYTRHIGKSIYHTAPASMVDKIKHYCGLTYSTGRMNIFEYEFNDDNQKTIYKEARITPCGNHELLIIVRNITDRKETEQKMHYISSHDALTGLYNRSYFEEELNRIERCRHTKVGVIICDVNNLKYINDSVGHEVGDRLLKAAANVLKGCFRPEDVVARTGGDEFAIILARITKKAMKSMTKRIKDAVKNYKKLNPDPPLSISVGTAAGINAQVRLLLTEADSNMYQDKLLYKITSIQRNLCVDCKWFDWESRGKVKCQAFPRGIPELIWEGKVNHTKSFPGDQGRQYVKVDDIL